MTTVLKEAAGQGPTGIGQVGFPWGHLKGSRLWAECGSGSDKGSGSWARSQGPHCLGSRGLSPVFPPRRHAAPFPQPGLMIPQDGAQLRPSLSHEFFLNYCDPNPKSLSIP